MPDLKIPDVKDVIQGELAARGEWIVANIATTMAWPVKSQKVRYCGLDLWIMPLMTDRYPAIAVNRPSNILRTECELAVMRFLSTLCWIEALLALVRAQAAASTS